MTPRVVIVGGGLAGLVTAYDLRKAVPDPARLDVVGIEASGRLGGPLWTTHRGGYLIEEGADSFLTTKPAALELVRDLGLGDRLVRVPVGSRRTYVWHGERLVPLPDGLRLLATPRLLALLRSPLLSPRGKLRVARDLLGGKGPDTPDESLASFVRRRLGDEVLDRMAAPLVAGIHAGDPERLSMEALLPRFRAYEREHGSVIRGLRAEGDPASAGGPGPFASLAEGMGSLPERLVARTPGVGWQMNAIVDAVESSADGGFDVVLRDAPSVRANVVVLGTRPRATSDLVRRVHVGLSEALKPLSSSSSAVVTLGLSDDRVRRLDGTGVLVPPDAGLHLRASTWSSSKFPGRAPPGHALLRAFYGGSRDEGVLSRPDEGLTGLALDELAPIAGLRGAPDFVQVRRWRAAHPQYEVGHLERVRRIEALEASVAGLVLTGSGYRGVGIPDCVADGERAANRVLAALGKRGRRPSSAS